MPDRSPRTYEV